jgi:hypothetical protein
MPRTEMAAGTGLRLRLAFPDCVIVLPAPAKFPALWACKRRAQNLCDLEDQAACVDSTLPIMRLERSRSTADACACVVHATAQVS